VVGLTPDFLFRAICYKRIVPPRSRGKFITFEGLDGVGKSTQLQKLADYLRGRGLPVVDTREPGGTVIGDQLRSVLLNSRTAGLSPLAELGMMFAARAQHIDELILPALNRGEWVLCDRFIDSSEAYQGGGRELGVKPILQLHRVLCRNLQPDLTILMVSDPVRSLVRARRRNIRNSQAATPDEGRFEQESGAFYRRVFDAYLAIAKREKRVVKVNATETIQTVHENIVRHVERRLKIAPKR
jgi:dTMP kinase